MCVARGRLHLRDLAQAQGPEARQQELVQDMAASPLGRWLAAQGDVLGHVALGHLGDCRAGGRGRIRARPTRRLARLEAGNEPPRLAPRPLGRPHTWRPMVTRRDFPPARVCTM